MYTVKNIKTNKTRIVLLVLAVLFVATNIVGVLGSVFPSYASAADAGAPIYVPDSSISCGATIKNPSNGLNELNPMSNGSGALTVINGGFDASTAPAEAKAVFQAIATQSENVIPIVFTGANNAGYADAQCAGSMVLFRRVSDTASTKFYGFWRGTPGTTIDFNSLKVVTGSVNLTTKSLTFGLPGKGTYTINLADQNPSILANPQYFSGTGTGGGTASTNTLAGCLNTYNTGSGSSQVQSKCLDNRGASFIDVAHINLDGETYTAQQWGGDSITYALDGSNDAALNALGPSFVLDTSQGTATDISIQEDGTNLEELQHLRDVLASKGSTDIEFQVNGTKVGTISTSFGSISRVATYYPDKTDPKADSMQLAFTNGAGGNESHFYGTYAYKDANTFVISAGGFAECGTAKQPRFELLTAPSRSQMDGVTSVRATWYVQTASTCKEVAIPVLVLLEKPGTDLPSTTTGGQQNGSQTVTCEAAEGAILAWLFCPIINGLAHAVAGIYSGFVEPMLKVDPIPTSNTGPNAYIFQIWQNFRVFGNIFLIIALLVIVFGQSIGGGAIDAYTARKVLPRLLIAAIAINLSIYIVAFAIDVSNIVGAGVASLIQQPFGNTNNFNIILGNGTGAAGIGLLAIVGGGIWAWSLGGALVQFLFVFVLLPAFFIFIAILVTIVIRQALIIFLVLVAPVAFALYTLPNTEQYFRRWWDLLFRTLLVYPIIMVTFALANIMSVLISKSGNGTGQNSFLSQILSIVVLVIPLVAIPYSFRLAGGLLGKLHDVVTNYGKRSTEAIKGNQNDPTSLRNRTRQKMGGQITRGRAQTFRTLDKKNILPGANAFIFGSALEKEALLNQQTHQRVFTVKDFGDDSVINARASFIDTRRTISDGNGTMIANPNFGKRTTLDGKSVSDAQWKAANMQYPTLGDLQAVADYRSTKVLTTEEAQRFSQYFGMMAQQQGLSANEATGIYTGLSFARQNERGEFKYGAYTQNDDGSFTFSAVGDQGSYAGDVVDGKAVSADKSRSANFVKEQYTKRGAWEGSKMFASYFQSMGDIKKTHLDKLSEFDALEQAGTPLSADQQALKQHSRDQLKQILEIEDSFGKTQPYRDESGEVRIMGGLQGASAATVSAFEKMRMVGNSGSKEAPVLDGNLASIRSEIDAGQTYEATHSPTSGDFSDRPYTT